MHISRFFRWATDRLQGRDGVVCFVSNNSFIDQIAFDGMRKNLLQDFTQIYHLDLHGNVRKNPKLSGTTHNVFGIQVGVGITIAIRSSKHTQRSIFYYRVPEFWRKTEKLTFLSDIECIANVEWQELTPDKRETWRTEGLHADFDSFLPLGTKEAKIAAGIESIIFKIYSRGVMTCRDNWVYDFNPISLASKMKGFIDTYNGDVDHWRRRGSSKETVDDFVTYDDKQIKWSGDLKVQLVKGKYATYSEQNIRHSLFRPFVKRNLYFDSLLNNSVYLQHLFFPTIASEFENTLIVVSDHGYRSPFSTLATNFIPDLHLIATTDTFQCFPYYTYAEDGSNRRENITDWALSQFQAKYSSSVTKWDIFHYVYALLHHPQYRARYAENLKRDLPHIPLLHRVAAFQICARIGKQLMELHLHYEQASEYPLQEIENPAVPFSYRVEKMRLTPDRAALVVNPSLTLAAIPPQCFAYRLGNRSALEWVIDQYQVSEDKRSGIVSDPNNLEDEEYIVRLVRQVVTVSVETVRLVDELAHVVTMADWMEEQNCNV